MNHSQKEKQKTTTPRITRLSFVLLTSVVLVLSSIAAVQVVTNNNNAAFAEVNCEVTETDGILEETCSGGSAFGGEGSEEIVGGGSGGHTTCTTDLSTGIQTCTESGGSGFTFGPRSDAGGGGGRFTCTSSPFESDCSGVGGSSFKDDGEEEEG